MAKTDVYKATTESRRRYHMPDAFCRGCREVFKPWPLSMDEKSWPLYEDVSCPKCKQKVRVFADKDLERRYYEKQLAKDEQLTNIADRLSMLESRTAELPEKDGIKRLKAEVKEIVTEILNDFRAKQNAEPKGGGSYH